MKTGEILIIDDDPDTRTLLANLIEREEYDIHLSGDYRSAFKLLADRDIDIILSDVNLPDANAIDLVEQLKQGKPMLEVIMLTAYGTIQDGVKALKAGAYDYITKWEDKDKIVPIIGKALEKVQMRKRLASLEQKVNTNYSFDKIIGSSASLSEATALAKQVANADATVLLTGETGTGKEVFARAIHAASLHADKAFVAINCSAFSKELLESELFGHKQGSFTGATKDKKGLFEEANGGTIFLDEIGEMNIDLQAKILRVLEDGTFIKVGDTKATKVKVRVLAATNRDLKEEIQRGRFREDLYYRLSVFTIILPPLRERVKDIPLLAQFFVAVFNKQYNRKVASISASFMERLKSYAWHGNIRELRNVIERSMILTQGETLEPDSLPGELRDTGTQTGMELKEVEKHHIGKVLLLTKGNKTEAARVLNIGLSTLYRKIEEYKLLTE